jgi:ParB family chromosome partitioning protein
MSSTERQEVVQVEVDKILIPEDRVTSILDDEILEELERSIRQHGILQPLQLAELNGQLVLIDGLHRLYIAKKLGMKTVPAIIKPMTEDQLLITNLIMNRQRGKSNPAHEAKILAKLVDEYGYDFDRAASILGMSRHTADRYYRIAKNASAKTFKFLESGVLSVGCAYWLSYIEDKAKQDEIAEYAVKWGYTVEQCKAAALSVINPSIPTQWEMTMTGEMKPKPIPVYPCGREVEPSKTVVITFDAEVWPVVEEALKRLCDEGFFYGEAVEQPIEQPIEAPKEIKETPKEVTIEQPKPKPKDWFLERL